jgi:signal transduction histidine kinase
MQNLQKEKNFSLFWKWWTGENLNFTLESRIFHSFSFVVISAVLFVTPINYYNNLIPSFLLTLEILLIQCVTYCISRFRNKLALAVDISAVNINLILAVNYLHNGGIEGPSLLLYIVSLFLLLSISRLNKLPYWLMLNIVFVAIVVALEYYYGEKLITPYPSAESRLFDMISTYFICLVLIYVGTLYLKKSYITQKKIVSEKAEALKVLNDEKDKIFSVISHDLRTPLANVQQYLELAGSVELTPDERKVIKEDLLELTKNAQELLNNLLHWSKNQMKGNTANKRLILVLEEFSPTFNLMKSIAMKKGILLEVEIKNNELYADVEMLKLIFRNLIHNAIKFTPNNGSINICFDTDEHNYHISIKDNGIGIKEEEQVSIFTISTKTNYGTNKEKGTGLGLMLCKEYTDMQGGKIWFTSKEKEGTSFYLSFPKKGT